MRSSYSNTLVEGEWYDFYVSKGLEPAALVRRGRLTGVSLVSQYARLIWNGQLYDVPLRQVKTRWRRVKEKLECPEKKSAKSSSGRGGSASTATRVVRRSRSK